MSHSDTLFHSICFLQPVKANKYFTMSGKRIARKHFLWCEFAKNKEEARKKVVLSAVNSCYKGTNETKARLTLHCVQLTRKDILCRGEYFNASLCMYGILCLSTYVCHVSGNKLSLSLLTIAVHKKWVFSRSHVKLLLTKKAHGPVVFQWNFFSTGTKVSLVEGFVFLSTHKIYFWYQLEKKTANILNWFSFDSIVNVTGRKNRKRLVTSE